MQVGTSSYGKRRKPYAKLKDRKNRPTGLLIFDNVILQIPDRVQK